MQGPVLGRAFQMPGLAGRSRPSGLHGLRGSQSGPGRYCRFSEKSEFTSVFERITALQARSRLELLPGESMRKTPRQLELLAGEREKALRDRWLCPIGHESPEMHRGILSITLEEYMNLIDWTGRQINHGHRGSIPEHLSPIMVRLQIESSRWLDTVSGFGCLFRRVAGRLDSMLKAHKAQAKMATRPQGRPHGLFHRTTHLKHQRQTVKL